jgi:hypothetical protein
MKGVGHSPTLEAARDFVELWQRTHLDPPTA